MNFLRSRLTLVGALLALPIAQISGCAVKDREYGPVGGGGSGAEGGASAGKAGGGKAGSGGKAGTTGKGGSGAEAGEGSAGASGEGATGTNGGAGGSTSSGGSSGEGGDGGEAGSSSGSGGTTGGRGGEGGESGANDGGAGTGSGGTSGSAGSGGGGAGNGGNGGSGGGAACVPTSGTESNCADGIDNDCDGVTDCLTASGAFPDPNGAAAGEHVEYGFETPHSSASFECRRVRGNTAGGEWGSCGRVSGATVYPFPTGTSSDPSANDGLWTTEVRLAFPNRTYSNVFSRTVYIHSSLLSATRCSVLASDQDYFTVAEQKLQMAGAFVDSTIRAPFISIDFDPPVNGTYQVGSGDGTINLRSLRHRFSFNADRQMMLMTRNYSSRLGSYGCNALKKRVHNVSGSWVFGAHVYQTCTGIVFNKKGAGVCIDASSGTAVDKEHVREDYGVQVPSSMYSPEADNFAWRKLRAEQKSGFNVVFSPKCDSSGCASGNTLFLPDKSYFSYWRD